MKKRKKITLPIDVEVDLRIVDKDGNVDEIATQAFVQKSGQSADALFAKAEADKKSKPNS